MAAYQYDDFERRMRRINRRHAKLSRGFVTTMNADGLVVARPKQRVSALSPRGILLTLAVLLLFKGLLHFTLGPLSYNERVEKLSSGTVVEQVGAWVMTADPATVWISTQVSSLVR